MNKQNAIIQLDKTLEHMERLKTKLRGFDAVDINRAVEYLTAAKEVISAGDEPKRTRMMVKRFFNSGTAYGIRLKYQPLYQEVSEGDPRACVVQDDSKNGSVSVVFLNGKTSSIKRHHIGNEIV